MKKLISTILSTALALSMSSAALAAENSASLTELGTQEIPVTGTYVAGEAGGTEYSIDIEWTSMSFTYKGASEKTWNPTSHQYEGEEIAAGWTAESSGTITITNHSNAFLTVTSSYARESEYNSAGIQFKSVGHIYSAEVDNKAQTGTITVTPTGSLPEETTDAVIGSITLTITEMSSITQNEKNTILSKSNEADAYYNAYNEFSPYENAFMDAYDAYTNDPSDANDLAVKKAYIDALVKFAEIEANAAAN